MKKRSLKGNQLTKLYSKLSEAELTEKKANLEKELATAPSEIKYLYQDQLFLVKKELQTRGLIQIP